MYCCIVQQIAPTGNEISDHQGSPVMVKVLSSVPRGSDDGLAQQQQVGKVRERAQEPTNNHPCLPFVVARASFKIVAEPCYMTMSYTIDEGHGRCLVYSCYMGLELLKKGSRGRGGFIYNAGFLVLSPNGN